MKAIYKRELKGYFTSMIGYVVIAVLAAVVGGFSCYYNIGYGHPYFEYVLNHLVVVFVLIVCISILAMKSFAEERYEKTDKLLYSLPVNMKSIVMGKYFAMLTVYLIPVLFFCLYPPVLSIFGEINFMQTYSCILMFYLLGAVLISISMFVSTLTQYTVIAAVISFGALSAVYIVPVLFSALLPDTAVVSFVCITIFIGIIGAAVYGLTKNVYAGIISAFVLEICNLVLYLVKPAMFEGAFPKMLNSISVFERFSKFASGTFDLTAVVYYISVIAVFAFLTTQSLEKKRYC